MSTLNVINMDLAQQLDTSGLRCPIPIMQTKYKISKLTHGERLLVIATDPSFEIDFMVFIRQSGHILLNSWQEGEKFFFVLQHNHRSLEAT